MNRRLLPALASEPSSCSARRPASPLGGDDDDNGNVPATGVATTEHMITDTTEHMVTVTTEHMMTETTGG